MTTKYKKRKAILKPEWKKEYINAFPSYLEEEGMTEGEVYYKDFKNTKLFKKMEEKPFIYITHKNCWDTFEHEDNNWVLPITLFSYVEDTDIDGIIEKDGYYW